MLGYANFSPAFSGEAWVENYSGRNERESVSFKATANYLKLGAKLGWRMSFGKNGGFTFEPSLGYYYGIRISDSIGKQLANNLGGDVKDFDQAFNIIENFIFVGGPRVSLAFGWRF
jgi:hypothetical protein